MQINSLTRHSRIGLTLTGALMILAACTDREVIFEGPRFDVRSDLAEVSAALDSEGAVEASTSRPDPATFGDRRDITGEAAPIKLAKATANADWTHRNGSVRHTLRHPAFAANPTLVWTGKIGTGETRRNRISADPVVAGGRVFTMDTRAELRAHGANGGLIWSRNLTPPSERPEDASTGSLSFGAGKLFATTGFGELVALKPDTGAVIWRQDLDAVVTGSATVVGNLVYVVSRDGRAWALGTEDGRVKWQLPGIPGSAVRIGGPGPTITDRLVIFPFGSGEMIGALRKSGLRVWTSSVNGERLGRAYAGFADVTSDPVLVGNTIYAGSQSGRVVAVDAVNGNRIWTANEGAISPVWPAGNSVFLISDEAQLVRLNARTGDVIWSRSLPYFVNTKIKRRKAIYAHYGPVLAGGRLWVASDDKVLKGFDPASGELVTTVDLPGGAASAPVVANGTMYIVTKKGQLLAYR